MIEFIIDPNPEASLCEAADCDHDSCEYRRAEEERRRLVAACAEHEWEMDLFDPEDDMLVGLRCVRCPADTHDLYPDSSEMLYAEFAEAVVEAGQHNSPVALIVPVDVDVQTWRHWTDYGAEWDIEIQIEQRGPARLMFDEITEVQPA